MKTTLYGNGKSTNEFGTPKVPKETHFVHPIYQTKLPLSIPSMRELCIAFHETHGRYPTELHVAGPSIGTRYSSFAIGSAIVGLDITYGAEVTEVA